MYKDPKGSLKRYHRIKEQDPEKYADIVEKHRLKEKQRRETDLFYRAKINLANRKSYAKLHRAGFGQCPICLWERKLVKDHCHDTGKRRDDICGKCNSGLGFFDHEPETLRRAADYIERHRRLHSEGKLAEKLDVNLAPGRAS